MTQNIKETIAKDTGENTTKMYITQIVNDKNGGIAQIVTKNISCLPINDFENSMLLEKPTQKSVEIPIERPKKVAKLELIENATEIPFGKSVEVFLKRPIDLPISKPESINDLENSILFEKPTEKSVEIPMERPMKVPKLELIENSAEIPFGNSAEVFLKRPIELPISKPVFLHVKGSHSKNPKQRFECERCHEKLLIRAYTRHLEPCKHYHNFIEKINHTNTSLCAIAERKMLQTIGGDCDTAIGGFAEIKENNLKLKSQLFSDSGDESFEYELVGRDVDAAYIGKSVGEKLLSLAGKKFKKK